ncbi:MAG TPA: hypothetical protein VFE24_05165 [Pirellulales bacterium]|jgi:hypothetical protein|nr:hypothetical protein [Pirellulales bacterium]
MDRPGLREIARRSSSAWTPSAAVCALGGLLLCVGGCQTARPTDPFQGRSTIPPPATNFAPAGNQPYYTPPNTSNYRPPVMQPNFGQPAAAVPQATIPPAVPPAGYPQSYPGYPPNYPQSYPAAAPPTNPPGYGAAPYNPANPAGAPYNAARPMGTAYNTPPYGAATPSALGGGFTAAAGQPSYNPQAFNPAPINGSGFSANPVSNPTWPANTSPGSGTGLAPSNMPSASPFNPAPSTTPLNTVPLNTAPPNAAPLNRGSMNGAPANGFTTPNLQNRNAFAWQQNANPAGNGFSPYTGNPYAPAAGAAAVPASNGGYTPYPTNWVATNSANPAAVGTPVNLQNYNPTSPAIPENALVRVISPRSSGPLGAPTVPVSNSSAGPPIVTVPAGGVNLAEPRRLDTTLPAVEMSDLQPSGATVTTNRPATYDAVDPKRDIPLVAPTQPVP